jgi:hypothetical protein
MNEQTLETLAVSPSQAAKIIGLQSATLEKDRRLGHLGIPFVKAGRRILYRFSDLQDWLEKHKQTTSRSEVTPEVCCKTDPRAPHGFDRNASHSADRYVCECEGWEPVDNAYTKLDTTAGVLHKEWVGLTKEDFYKKDDETVFVLGMKFAEARLKEKNT